MAEGAAETSAIAYAFGYNFFAKSENDKNWIDKEKLFYSKNIRLNYNNY